MKKFFFTIGYVIYIGVILGSVYAQKVFAISCDQPGHPCTLLDAAPIVPLIVNSILITSGITFFFTLVLAGFNFLTANADPQRIENARKTFFVSLLGFALIYLPFFVIPKLVEIAGVKSNINVHTGTIAINLDATFTATPLPPYLYSHNPAIILPQASANTINLPEPVDTVDPAIGKVDHSYKGCGRNKIAYCMLDTGDYIGQIDSSQSLDGAIAETLNGYRNFEGCNGLAMSDVASTVVSATDVTTYITQKATQIGAKDCNVPAFRRFHAFTAVATKKGDLSDPATIELINFAHIGLPTIAHLSTGYVILDDANDATKPVQTITSGNDVEFIDPAGLVSCSKATCTGNQKSMVFGDFMNLWDGTFLMLQPAGDPSDAIYTLFGGIAQIQPVPSDVAKMSLFSVMMGECIALHESNFNENAIGSPNYDGSQDHGTLQINDTRHFSSNYSMNELLHLLNTLPLSQSQLDTLNKPLQQFKNPAGGYILESNSVYNSVFNVEAAYEIYHQGLGPYANSFLYNKWSTYLNCW